MNEFDVISNSLYSDVDFLNEDKESCKEDQARKRVSDFKNSLGVQLGQEYDPLILHSLKGRDIQHLQTSPILGFKEKLTEISENMSFGTHFHGVGKGLVKGANLAFRTKRIDGAEMTELDFKVNHVFRSKIQNEIDALSKLDSEGITTVLSLTGSHGKGIRLEHNQPFPLGNTSMGTATKIAIEGLGSIYIGAIPDLPTMYDRVVVHMGADKNIYDFHELLAFLNLDQSFHQSNKEDMDRLKIGHLFRTFYPREALPLERSEDFFSLPVNQIITKIVEDIPEMQNIFNTYFNQMTPEEILPGKLRYRINGLAKKAYELGARGLTAAITGVYSPPEIYKRIASILKLGMLSSEIKKEIGLNARGTSSSADFYSGGADSVFSQMITEKNCHDRMNFNDLNYNSDIRLLISLDALEMGTYQYFDDGYGNRKLEPSYWNCDYSSRPGILEFVDNLQNNPNSPERETSPDDEQEILDALKECWGFADTRDPRYTYFMNSYQYAGHEVMIKERIDPSFIKRIVVSNSGIQSELVSYLKECNLVDQKEWIFGIPLDQFIVIANNMSDDLFGA